MKIVILAGGISTERDVSFSSGSMVYRALEGKGHQLILLDVYLGYEKEDWKDVFTMDTDWAKEIGAISESNPDIDQVKAMRKGDKKSFFGPHVLDICKESDVVFMALHGENGENGKVQACFDLLGIRYTGTDYVSSALSMDKGISKDLFVQAGVSTPKGIRFKRNEEIQNIPFPVVVKACCGGSSVGVCMAGNEEEYEKALQEAFKYDNEVIVEQYIKGREFSVGVMEGKALPIIEIAPLEGFYDYKNKYQEGSTIETCPAKLSEVKTKEMKLIAEKVFRTLRLKSYARIDFMMNDKEEIFCLEANTLPGMTPTSLLPQEAAAIGTSFSELCDKIIEMALK